MVVLCVLLSFLATKHALPAAAVAPSSPLERWSSLADTVFQQIGKDQGLSHQVTTALAEDGDGFLWVGTQDGLARWDGYRMRTFRFDAKDPDALPDNFIQTLHTDRSGQLWIGTNSGGLARFDREHERFMTIGAGPTGLSNVLVWAITDDGAGGTWVGTAGGLDHLAPTGTISHLRHDPADSGSLPDNNIRALLLDRHGTLWVGTRKGLVRRAAGARRFEAVGWAATSDLPPSVVSLCEGGDGRIWVGTRNNGGYVVDPATDQAHALVASAADASTPATERVYAIVEIRPGVVWLGTYGQGILEIDSASGKARRLLHDATLGTSLPNNTVLALHRDHAGLVWVASDNGLARHDPSQAAILTLFGASLRPNGISDSDVTSVLSTTDGRVWLGLHHMGVDLLDPSLGRVAALQPNPARPQSGLPTRHVVALAQSGNGDVFIATGGGLYRANAGATQVARVVWPGRDPTNSVNALALNDPQVWVGSREDGAWQFDLKSRSAVRPPGIMNLSDQRVSAIAREPSGALWLGTFNGLNRYDPVNGRVEAILPQATVTDGLASGQISSLLIDRQGRLWVGTSGGINILESRSADGRPHFRQLGTAQGLPDAGIAQMLEDKAGHIWASTGNGLAVIDPSSFVVRALHSADGDAITAYWSNSGAVTPQGELLFGGLGGLTVIRPEQLRTWDYRPPVVVTEVRIGGQLVAASRYNGGAKVMPLIVSPEGNSLAVEFAALDYSAPELNRYAYQLIGYDRDWIATDASRRLAAYTNLPPGDYLLRLRGSNRAGVWTEKSLALPIQVLPAWYQTLWFRLLLVMLALTCAYGLVRWRTAALRQRQHELEQTVAQRTQALHDAKEQLTVQKEAAESANLSKSRFLAAASHDLRQPMHTISLLVGLLRGQNRDPAIETIVSKIQSSTLTMGEMFASLLDISKFDAGAVHTHVRVFEVADLLRWIMASFEAQAIEKGLTLRVVDSTAWVDSDPVLLQRILGNLVSNAIRYTDHGGILVGCRRRGTTLCVQVWDSGIGIPSAQQDEIFEEFFQVANPERDRSKGLGLGLSIAKRCALLLGHSLTVRSKPGKGTVFSVDLPQVASQAASPAMEPSPITDGMIANAFVVVIEDGAENLDATEALLQRWGCHTVGASSSRAAIAALENHLRIPDLIISDYRLRDGLNGIAAIGAIRRWAEQPIPAILVTADLSTAEQLTESDTAIALLHKPVGADQLRRLAEELLAQPVQPV